MPVPSNEETIYGVSSGLPVYDLTVMEGHRDLLELITDSAAAPACASETAPSSFIETIQRPL